MKLSVLVSARRNSKYLAKFLAGFIERTGVSEDNDIEVLVMLNEHDNWNDEIIKVFSQAVTVRGEPVITFYRENLRLGRAGLHEYFNRLARKATGDWLVYFCEDHFITMQNWNEYIAQTVINGGSSGDAGPIAEAGLFPLDPAQPWVLIPKFDNCGAMNHVVSRGFVKALGGVVGKHGWIDSYINDLMKIFPERVIRMDDEMFHDFTHDSPSPMSEAHMQAVSTEKGKNLPVYDSDAVRRLIAQDQINITKVIQKEARR